MPKVVGVRFRTSPRMYWFAPVGEDEQYKKDVSVIVETQRGVEIGTIVMPPKDVEESEIVAPLKSVLRIATDEDITASGIEPEKKRDILATAKQKVAERALDMKIVDCEYTVDRSKLVLYFTAEQRVDFRELVRDLASAFHMRIDLRQISARDECKLIGSLSACGLPCCCGRFESDSEHVSIKMAKNQNLALTPNKINGMCGRLLCCLAYENRTYEDVIKRAPKHGAFVTAPDGRRGTVVSVTPLTEVVRVRFGDEDNFEFGDFPLSELNYERRPDANQNNKNNDQNNGGNNNNNANRNDRNNNANNGNNGPDGNRPNKKHKKNKNRDGERRGEQAGPQPAKGGPDQNGNNGGKNKKKKHRRDRREGGGRPEAPAPKE